MNSDRLSLFREAMDLESERSSIQTELARVSSRLTAIHGLLASGSETARLSKVGGSSGFLRAASKPKARAGRGELKAQILEALQGAGEKGIRVQPLAQSLGVNPVNIYSWFQISAKKIPQIKKIDRGLYRWEGPSVGNPPITKSPKIGKTKRSGKHGAIKAQVVATLKAAGSKGLTVRDLAAKIGVKQTNLSVWFSTTGKKNKSIKKVGPGHYKLA